MEFTTEKTRAGVKVYSQGKHVKTIPSRYEKYVNAVKLDLSKKRAQGEERMSFEWMYFLDMLQRASRHVYDLIKTSMPVKAYEVMIVDGSKRYEAELDNGIKVKIDIDLYKAIIEKDDTHFSNY